MKQPLEIDIVRRAYELWQQAGKPDDKDQEFYYLAEQELRNEDKSSPLRTPDNL
jgi:heat shock protein HspQ